MDSRRPEPAFSHAIVHRNMSLLTIHRPDFSEGDWEAFRGAHRGSYEQLERFHFVLDIRSVNPSACSHILPFIQYLSGMRERTEKQVASIYVITGSQGLITATIERLLRWYGNTIEILFMDTVEDAVSVS